MTTKLSKINRINLIISSGFPPSVFARLLFSFVQTIPPLYSMAFSASEQVREDTAEILPVCQLFVGQISPKEQLYATPTAMINVFTGR